MFLTPPFLLYQVPSRLEHAKNQVGCEVINFRDRDLKEVMREVTPDVCIEAVGE